MTTKSVLARLRREAWPGGAAWQFAALVYALVSNVLARRVRLVVHTPCSGVSRKLAVIFGQGAGCIGGATLSLCYRVYWPHGRRVRRGEVAMQVRRLFAVTCTTNGNGGPLCHDGESHPFALAWLLAKVVKRDEQSRASLRFLITMRSYRRTSTCRVAS
jgi:hypothetical protein